MQFRVRPPSPPPPTNSLPHGLPHADRYPLPRRLRARLTAGVLLLLATWLTFLIHYGNPVFPYLILAILVTCLWRFRVGLVCLLVSLAVLLLTVLRHPPISWGGGLDDLLSLTLLGLLALG